MGDLLQLLGAHEQAQLLLPWHASGTLEPDEAALLEAHLAECAECRRDLASERLMREIYGAMPVAGEPARAPVPVPRLQPRRRPAWRSVRQRLSTTWGKAAMAAAAAVALVVAVAPRQPDGEYQLLGSEPVAQTGNAIVLFAPETPARELRAVLEQAGARLVDGPTASGAYIVQVPEGGRGEALDGLRASPHVVLAEPVDAGTGP